MPYHIFVKSFVCSYFLSNFSVYTFIFKWIWLRTQFSWAIFIWHLMCTHRKDLSIKCAKKEKFSWILGSLYMHINSNYVVLSVFCWSHLKSFPNHSWPSISINVLALFRHQLKCQAINGWVRLSNDQQKTSRTTQLLYLGDHAILVMSTGLFLFLLLFFLVLVSHRSLLRRGSLTLLQLLLVYLRNGMFKTSIWTSWIHAFQTCFVFSYPFPSTSSPGLQLFSSSPRPASPSKTSTAVAKLSHRARESDLIQ